MRYFFIPFFLVAINFTSYAQPQIGTQVPDISLPNANGEEVKLSSLKGKVVLLSFWGSFCDQCRSRNYMVKSLYHDYKDKGFEVYGLSLDSDKKAWQDILRRDSMEWTQVIDATVGTGDELINSWNVHIIPAFFLIDQEGKLVATWPKLLPGKEDLERWLKKLL